MLMQYIINIVTFPLILVEWVNPRWFEAWDVGSNLGQVDNIFFFTFSLRFFDLSTVNVMLLTVP